jgi:hypothetical protein
MDSEKTMISVLIILKGVPVGIATNVGLVIGQTAGRLLPNESFGPDVIDGDGKTHKYLTKIAHFVREAGQSKLRTLRDQFADNPDVLLLDYTEDAAPSSYEVYTASLASHAGEQVVYRGLYLYGPEHLIVPATKNLSRL